MRVFCCCFVVGTEPRTSHMLGKCVTPELISRLGMAWGRGFFHVPRRSNWYPFVSPLVTDLCLSAPSGPGCSDVTSCCSFRRCHVVTSCLGSLYPQSVAVMCHLTPLLPSLHSFGCAELFDSVLESNCAQEVTSQEVMCPIRTQRAGQYKGLNTNTDTIFHTSWFFFYPACIMVHDFLFSMQISYLIVYQPHGVPEEGKNISM